MADAPPPFNKGRLVLVIVGLAAVAMVAWLLLRPIGPSTAVKVELPSAEQLGAEQPAAEQPVAHYLARADAARGQAYFARCASCHTVEQGGGQSIGPNLWGVMGGPIAGQPGYSYSSALSGRGGRWDWESMAAFLHNPRAFAPGTRMAYSGIWNPQDRADVLLYLNSLGGTLTPPAR
jgi:cytochrome c